MSRRILCRVIATLLVLLLLVPAPLVSAQRSTSAVALAPLSHGWLIQPDYMMAENERLTLYFDPTGLDVAVLEKATGQVWSNAVDQTVYTDNVANETALSGLITVGTRNSSSENVTVIYDGKKNGLSVQTTMQKSADGFNLHIKLKKLSIEFDMCFTLKEDGLDVQIPFESIKENGDEKLNYLRLMPFFGAGVSKNGGYIFFPDGCGTLMDFTENDRFTGCINLPFYGEQAPDIDYEEVRIQKGLENLGMPVFGLKSGDMAFLGNVYAGSADALLTIAPGGYIYSHLNRVYVTLNYRRTYLYHAEGENEQQFTDSELIAGDRGVFYSLLSGDQANYNGMARAYRGYLVENGMEKELKEGDEAPLFVSFFGGITAKSFLFNRFVPMTTFEEAGDILSDLRQAGVSQMSCELIGWNEGGYMATPTSTTPARKLGGQSGLQELYRKTEEYGIPLYLQANTMMGNKAYGDYNSRKDAVREYPGLIVTDRESEQFNLLNPDIVIRKLLPFWDTFLQKFDAFRLSFTGWGKQLYYDFNRNNHTSRTEAMLGIESAVAEFAQSHPRTAVDGNNLYVAKYATQILNLPDSDSGYVMADRSIPFYQMVIHGYKHYTTVAGNTTYDLTEQKLRWAEYGAQPYFILTDERAEELQGTAYNRLFTSEYVLWKDRVVEAYSWYRETMKPVYGATIYAHTQLEEGVVRVQYENGYAVYVNYLSEAKTYDGVTVPALSVKVVKG